MPRRPNPEKRTRKRAERVARAAATHFATRVATDQPEVQALAGQVFQEAVNWSEPAPVAVGAPLAVACANAAPFVAKQIGLDPRNKEDVEDVGALLYFAWLDRVANLAPADLVRFREEAGMLEGAARAAESLTDAD